MSKRVIDENVASKSLVSAASGIGKLSEDLMKFASENRQNDVLVASILNHIKQNFRAKDFLQACSSSKDDDIQEKVATLKTSIETLQGEVDSKYARPDLLEKILESLWMDDKIEIAANVDDLDVVLSLQFIQLEGADCLFTFDAGPN